MRSHHIVLALTLLTAYCAASPAPDAAHAPTDSADVDTAATVHTFTSDSTGFDTHSFWIDTGREVVVFDAQFTPAYAEQVIAAIKKETKSPIKWLVVTHPNPDKFNGASAFQAIGAKVVASKATADAIPAVHAYKKYFFVNMAKAFTEATYPAQATIDVTFEGKMSLPLEGHTTVELEQLTHRGVSSTQTVAWIPQSHSLIVGDLVHHHAHAWLEGSIVNGKATPDLASWKQALEELRAFKGATVYGGRGEPAKLDTAVDAEEAYLAGMDKIVTDYVASLGAAKTELTSPDANKHWKAITTQAEKAFPDYKLPYMVTYGVYGLAQQK